MKEVSDSIAAHNKILIARQLMMSPLPPVNSQPAQEVKKGPVRKLPPNPHR